MTAAEHVAGHLDLDGAPVEPAPLAVVGVDLSLTATGIATATGCRTLKSSGAAGASLRVRHARLTDIATRVTLAVSDAAAPRTALVVIEGPALSRNTGSVWDRAGLWWATVDELLSAGHLVAEVAPTCRARFATGKGNAGKAAVVSALTARYGVTFGDDNQADAFALRAMGLARLGSPLAAVPKTHVGALDAVQWPNLVALGVSA